eukprot:1580331-Rhodomonas_salina.1
MEGWLGDRDTLPEQVGKEVWKLLGTTDTMHCLGWNFLLSLCEHLGMNIVGGMSALSIPPMFLFTHLRWDMEECEAWPPLNTRTLM